MDAEHLSKLLQSIEFPINESYNNDAENLKSIMNCVHTCKEADVRQEATTAFVDSRGLEIMVTCMQRNLGDTVVLNRALEILAGEVHSNGSLPLLEKNANCRLLADLEFPKVLFDVLRLPDLQAVSRGLACRAIRKLCEADRKLIEKIVDLDLIDVLLAQVCHVDHPFVFAALSVVTRSSARGRLRVRRFPESLPLLLQCFSQRPYDYSPEKDPVASMLFLSTWSWDEIDQQLNLMGDERFETLDVLWKDHGKLYKWRNLAGDVACPMMDYSTETSNTYFYIASGQYWILALSWVGITFHTYMSTMALSKTTVNRTKKWKLAMNICTFGHFNLIREGIHSYDHGLKSDKLTGLKTFQSINSMIRFLVGTYSLLLAGYEAGYPELEGMELFVRWASVASSLCFLPGACVDVVLSRTLPGKRDYGQAFRGWSRRQSFLPSLYLYQGSEIWAQVTLLIFQLSTRSISVGAFICWFLQLTLLFVYVSVRRGCSCSLYTFAPIPMLVFWCCSGGATIELQHMSRAASILRVTTLVATWLWIASEMQAKASLREHLLSGSGLGLFVIAAVGTGMHLLTYVQQLCMGRWWFEEMDHQHSLWALGDFTMTKIKTNKVTSEDLFTMYDKDCGANETHKETGGLYDTAGAARLLVAARWKSIHDLLPNATARVPGQEFVSFCKSSASSGFVDLEVSDVETAHDRFLHALFVAATGLMYPKAKDDLGKHCFGYAFLLADEYYESPKTPPDKLGLLKAPAIGWFDPLKVLRVQVQDDWNHVQKDADLHVDLASFNETLLSRHVLKLSGIAEAQEAFKKFLERLFEALCLLSGQSDRQWIDQHGFIYGCLIAYEFYFADARDAQRAEGCGCSTPVADNLGLTVPLPTKRNSSS